MTVQNSTMQINITIVEDHVLFREGICSLLEAESCFKIAGQYSNGKEFLENLDVHKNDVILMDIEMPVLDGISTTKIATERYPNCKIIALSLYSDIHYYQSMIDAGIKGFVLKDAERNELETAIREIENGRTFFSQSLLTKVIQKLSEKDSISAQSQFGLKELELIKLICEGLSNKEISEKLFVSPKTVESNKTKLFEKLNVKNSIELVIYAIKNNIISIQK